MTMNMKLTLQHLSIRSTDTLDSWVEEQIFALREWLHIDEANVRLVRRPGASPAYQVKVHLVRPGPDLVAEGCDHTLQAAFAKMLAQIHTQITTRATRRVRRIKSNLQTRRAG